MRHRESILPNYAGNYAGANLAVIVRHYAPHNWNSSVRILRERVSQRGIYKIQRAKQRRSGNKVYFTDFTSSFQLGAPSSMNLGKKNFEAGDESKLLESAMLAKIANSDFILLAAWEKIFLRQKIGNWFPSNFSQKKTFWEETGIKSAWKFTNCSVILALKLSKFNVI